MAHATPNALVLLSSTAAAAACSYLSWRGSARRAELAAFCRALPKVELHAHLSGSVRDATVREILQARSDERARRRQRSGGARSPRAEHRDAKPRRRAAAKDADDGDKGEGGRGAFSVTSLVPSASRSLEECFALFGVLHAILSDLGIVERVARECVEDYAAENTRYT